MKKWLVIGMATIGIVGILTTFKMMSRKVELITETKKLNRQTLNINENNIDLKAKYNNGEIDENILTSTNVALDIVKKVTQLQNIISKQRVFGESPETPNQETKTAQNQLKKLINKSTAQMNENTYLGNWYVSGQKLDYKISITNTLRGLKVIWIVKDGDGKDIKYITGHFNPQNNKIDNLSISEINQ